ncbi:gamma-tubulin complex component 4 [Entomortierella parvispora]|uniref:Spindle pole body component n=1 Tax=Entomortierella parvispora TaxID=205924 RepID=A0A9P3HK28_9FUNG|nr:gamma-tubulin complex component 4 [Entomortierella parvispora]
MLHELLLTLSGYPGDIFQPFPLEPATPTTFAITNFPLLHPAEKEGLDRLAQLGFYYRDFQRFIATCRSSGTAISPTASPAHETSSPTAGAEHIPSSLAPSAPRPSLYLKAIGIALERKLNGYRQVIIQTEAAILSGEDNLGGMVPLTTISARFAPYQLIFPILAALIREIQDASLTENPYIGGRLLDLLQDRAASGVPIQKEWMSELLRGCYGIMMRQVVSWIIYGQIQDPFEEFFIVQQSAVVAAGSNQGSGHQKSESSGSVGGRRQMSTSSLYRSRISPSFRGHSSTMAAPASSNSIKWQAEYGIDESTLPKLIPVALAEAMLFIGKSIATARDAKPKPVPIPQSMTHQHQSLLLPLIPSATAATTEFRSDETILDMAQLTNVIYRIRRNVANHLWVVVQVGEKIVQTLESFRRYFLLCDGEFALGLIGSLEEFKRNRLSRLNSFVNLTSNLGTGAIRDHDLGGMLIKAAQGTPAQEDSALRSFELQLVKAPAAAATPSALDSATPTIGTSTEGVSPTLGMFDDQLLGIPVRLWYTLAWPLDFFLTTEDLGHYGDVFAFLMTVRKAQVKLQQAWIDVKSMTQQVIARNRGRGSRAYNRRIHGTTENPDGDDEHTVREREILKHIGTIRSDMIFVVDCLWTYLQMDVIGPTYDSLLKNIKTQEPSTSSKAKSSQDSNAMELDSSFAEPLSTTTNLEAVGVDKDTGEASSKSFDSIYSLHAEALHEIRRACLLTSSSLSQTVKNILIGSETFCGIVNRRAAGQDGFLSGLGQEHDERLWQDWVDISQLNQTFRENTAKLFADLSAVSKSGSLGDGPVLNRSGVFGSTLLSNSPKSFEVIRQVDQLLLRLEFSKSMWFAPEPVASEPVPS